MRLHLAYAEQRRVSNHSYRGPHERCTIGILRCGCGCAVCMKRRANYYQKLYDAERAPVKAEGAG